MKFILLKRNYDDKEVIIEVLKSFIGNHVTYNEDESYLAIYYSYDDDEDVRRTLLALGSELMFNVHGYISMDLEEESLSDELSIAKDLIENVKADIYTLKSALLAQDYILDKRKILSFILSSSGINEQFVKDFAECDLNVSKASKVMYMHRNTMLYKLDKLYSLTGFDLRSFKDAYIVYNLIEGK